MTPMGSLIFSEERIGKGVRGRWREWEQGLVCKMIKDLFFKKVNKKNNSNLNSTLLNKINDND